MMIHQLLCIDLYAKEFKRIAFLILAYRHYQYVTFLLNYSVSHEKHQLKMQQLKSYKIN